MHQYYTYTDSRDRQTYKVIKVGNTFWFAENLRYASPHSLVDEGSGVRYYYGTNLKDAAPKGWKIAGRKDFKSLFNHAGGSITKVNEHGLNIKANGIMHHEGVYNPREFYFMTAAHPGLFIKDKKMIVDVRIDSKVNSHSEWIHITAAPVRCLTTNKNIISALVEL